MPVRVIATLAALAALMLPGCPRDVQEPEPGEAQPCEALEDCNAGLRCGGSPLRACVDGLCESSPSLVVPCVRGRDAGP